VFSLQFGKKNSFRIAGKTPSSQFLRMAKSVISLATVEFPFYPQNKKCLKKMVCNKLTPIISARIFDRQHGYMKGRFTVTNLVEFSNFAFDGMENERQVDCVYTDFSNAFDSVTKDLEGPMLCWFLLDWPNSKGQTF
jgi:hypothetical protein